MEEENNNRIKVYIKINASNCVIDINSSVFISDLTDWIEIDEGLGNKYSHAQNNYFDTPLTNEQGIYLYKWTGEEVIKRTDEEIQADTNALPSQEPTSEEKLQQQLNEQQLSFNLAITEMTMLINTLTGGGE